jgi:hypothetical protein
MLWLSFLIGVLVAGLFWIVLALTSRGECPLKTPAVSILLLLIGVEGAVIAALARQRGRSGVECIGHMALGVTLTVGLSVLLLLHYANHQECFASRSSTHSVRVALETSAFRLPQLDQPG